MTHSAREVKKFDYYTDKCSTGNKAWVRWLNGGVMNMSAAG